MTLTGLLQDEVPVDGRLAGFPIDVGDEELRRVEWKGRGPQELTVIAIEREQAAAFTHTHRDVSLLVAGNIRIHPFHKFRIGIDRGPHEDSLVRVVLIPIVARQMLVIPGKLARIWIQRHGRIRVEIGGRGF